MIKSFKHKGLQRFFETASKAGIQAQHAPKLRMQLAALNTATELEDMTVPGWDLHPLVGNFKGKHAITVNGNWRVVFEFKEGNAYVVNYEDYH